MGTHSRYGLMIAGTCVVVALAWLLGYDRHTRGTQATGDPVGRDDSGSTRAVASNLIATNETTGSPAHALGSGAQSEDTPTADRAQVASGATARNGSEVSVLSSEAKAPGSDARAGLATDVNAAPDGTPPLSSLDIELPMPEFGLTSSPEAIVAYERVMRRACETRFWDIRAGYYEEFLEEYPLSGCSLTVMARLAMAYAEMGRLNDARRVLEGAGLLAGDNRFVNFLDVMLAGLDVRSHRLTQAGARLREVIKRPIPNSLEDEYAVAGQRFLAPIRLAGILAAQGRADEADRLLAETCQVGLEWIRAHREIEWIPSYVTYASYERVRLALNSRGSDDAVPIMDEVRQYLSDLEDKQGYGQVMELLAIADYNRACAGGGGGTAPAEMEGR